jgi:hypothetical protein
MNKKVTNVAASRQAKAMFSWRLAAYMVMNAVHGRALKADRYCMSKGA